MINKHISLIIVFIICNSCNKEDQCILSNEDINSEVTTRTSYIGGTISGEKSPYVGDGTYRYTLSFNKQSNPIGIKISAVGGGAKIKDPSTNRYGNEYTKSIPKGTSQYSFDVLWTQPESSAVLMIRPNNSTIELTADLRDINVRMKPMSINAPSTFELGDTITLWCNYPLNKDTYIKWTYDKELFSEVSQSASVTQSKFQIDLKSIQSSKESNIGVEISDFFINAIGARTYFVVRRGSSKLSDMIAPQISGSTLLKQYNTYTYTLSLSSNLSNIQWTDNEYIKCIQNKNGYSVKLNPIKAGNGQVYVSYNYKNSTERYYSSMPITIDAVFPDIIGDKNICYNNSKSFSIKDQPPGSSVQWSTTGGTNPQNYIGDVYTCKNISSTITMPRLYATIVLPSGFTIEKESYLRLFNPNASFEKGNLVPDQIDAVNANITVSLMGYPNWATNFTWSSTNVSGICIQGQPWTCISYNSFEAWDSEVEIKVAYQSPCGDWYEVSEMFPIVH